MWRPKKCPSFCNTTASTQTLTCDLKRLGRDHGAKLVIFWPKRIWDMIVLKAIAQSDHYDRACMRVCPSDGQSLPCITSVDPFWWPDLTWPGPEPGNVSGGAKDTRKKGRSCWKFPGSTFHCFVVVIVCEKPQAVLIPPPPPLHGLMFSDRPVWRHYR